MATVGFKGLKFADDTLQV